MVVHAAALLTQISIVLCSLAGITEGTAFQIGYLPALSRKHGKKPVEGPKVSGALSFALRQINRDPTILRDHTLELKYLDNQADTLTSISALTTLWKNGSVAFFGPEETCQTEAEIAAAWNLPMYSYNCGSGLLYKTYKTFARTDPPNAQHAKSIISLMLYFGWKKFTLVVGTEMMLLRTARTLKQLATLHNVSLNGELNYTEPYSTFIHSDRMSQIITRTHHWTRVYVILSGRTALVDFAREMEIKGLTATGEYVIIGLSGKYSTSNTARALYKSIENINSLTNASIRAFQNVIQLAATPPSNPNYTLWQDTVRSYLYRPPFSFKRPSVIEQIAGIKVDVSISAANLYDAVFLYARALDQHLKEGGNPRDGTAIVSKILGKPFMSIQGHLVYINENGEAESNSTCLLLRPDSNKIGFGMKPVASFFLKGSDIPEFKELEVMYPNGVPRDEPKCGYDGLKCIPEQDVTGTIVGGCLGGLAFLSLLGIFMGYRNWRYEQALASLIWKIDFDEIKMKTGRDDVSTHSMSTVGSLSQPSTMEGSLGGRKTQLFTDVGLYRGNLVAIQWVHRKHVDLTRAVKLELKQMRDLRHDNIVAFVGACVDHPNISIITEYCSKGSLQDVLENCDIRLDEMFAASLVFDIIKGMIYLHESIIKSHGNLKSSNCLIDSRWVLKISGFSSNHFRAGEDVPSDKGEYATYRDYLWTAPELLRDNCIPLGGTQSADVYAFGIILYEIHSRAGPYGNLELSPREIVHRVTNRRRAQRPFRPDVMYLTCPQFIIDAMEECWLEDPDKRPDFKTCRKRLRPMQKGMKSNIVDNMVTMMERYANNLEEIVAERTDALLEEKKKTEFLLHQMLPKTVADQLKRGESVVPETFESVTIYFSDICNFTAMSAESTPMQIVNLLNDLYTCFDSIIRNFDVYKVETIGDAYMVVSGLPITNGNHHAGEIASMALYMLAAIKQFKIRHRPRDVLKLRIGLHCGPCVAGVVGLAMPRYCLFGDTVNTASRMESHGEPLKIHVSMECKNLLDELGGYYLVERGIVRMKGKGEITTWWLLGENTDVRTRRISIVSPLPKSVSRERLETVPSTPHISFIFPTTPERTPQIKNNRKKKCRKRSNSQGQEHLKLLNIRHDSSSSQISDLFQKRRHRRTRSNPSVLEMPNGPVLTPPELRTLPEVRQKANTLPPIT